MRPSIHLATRGAKRLLKQSNYGATQQQADALLALLKQHPPLAKIDGNSMRTIVLFGWAKGSANRALNTKNLRALNPNFSISVARLTRHEFPKNRVGKNNIGFRVEAIGPASLKLTLPKTAEEMDISVSNPRASQVLSELSNNNFEKTTTDGYIDEVRSFPIKGRFSPTSASHLILEYPDSFLKIASADATRRLAQFGLQTTQHAYLSSTFRNELQLFAGNTDVKIEGWGLYSIEHVFGAPTTRVSSTIPVPLPRVRACLVDFGHERRHLPQVPIRWEVLKNVFVQDGAVVIDKSRHFVVDPSANPTNEFVSGQWQAVIGGAAMPTSAMILNRPVRLHIPRAALIAGRNDNNWYHFVCEYLPRLLQLDQAVPDDVPILISNRTPLTGKTFIRSLTSRTIIEVDTETRTAIDELYVAEPTLQVLDSIHIPWSDGIALNTEALTALREVVRKRYATNDRRGRYYLTRNSGHRRLLNDELLSRVAASHGLEVLDPATLTLEQQLSMFSNAELIVGAGGAVMANYLFLPSGARVLALTSAQLWNFVLPAVICDIAGVTFSYHLDSTPKFRANRPINQQKMHSDFKVTARSFRRSLRRELRILDDINHSKNPSTT